MSANLGECRAFRATYEAFSLAQLCKALIKLSLALRETNGFLKRCSKDRVDGKDQ